jgi:hypothetical protein
MSSISMNDEIAIASTVVAEEMVLTESVSVDNPAVNTLSSPVEAELNDIVEARLYLAGMTHFFSLSTSNRNAN